MFNATSDMVTVYVKWGLPKGYADSDIYGSVFFLSKKVVFRYEAPALFPIQCQTPEEELPSPRIVCPLFSHQQKTFQEIVHGGGRLKVSLPASILDARCRMWVEVGLLSFDLERDRFACCPAACASSHSASRRASSWTARSHRRSTPANEMPLPFARTSSTSGAGRARRRSCGRWIPKPRSVLPSTSMFDTDRHRHRQVELAEEREGRCREWRRSCPGRS